jgi:hypothetical protein
VVRTGQRHGRSLGDDYHEVRFEELVKEPATTLERIGRFIGRPLDYETIQSVGLGSVSRPNTSFAPDEGAAFDPVGRFRERLKGAELGQMESVIGDLLDELGYARGASAAAGAGDVRLKGTLYDSYLSAKLWARVHTPLGRRTSLESLYTW